MTDEVLITVSLNDLQALVKVATEASEDLDLYARNEYKGDHPSIVRRRENDLEFARSVKAAAMKFREFTDD